MSFRVPFLVGNTRHRDHFPQGVTIGAGPPSGDTSLMFTVAPDKAMKWLWRVKKWTISGSLTVNFTVVDDSFFPVGTATASGSLTLSLDALPLVMAAFFGALDNELQIATPGLDQGAEVVDDVTLFSTLTESIAGIGPAGITWNFNFAGLTKSLRIGAGIYWDSVNKTVTPVVIIGWGTNTDWYSNYPGRGQIHFGFSILIRPLLGTAAGTNLLVDGESTPLHYGLSHSGSPFITFTSLTATMTDFTVTPVEYWPFKNRAAGVPVYDTLSGAQLVDPFS